MRHQILATLHIATHPTLFLFYLWWVACSSGCPSGLNMLVPDLEIAGTARKVTPRIQIISPSYFHNGFCETCKLAYLVCVAQPPCSPIPFIVTRLSAKKWSVWFRALALHVIIESVLSLGWNKKHIQAERLSVGLRRVNKKTLLLENWRGLLAVWLETDVIVAVAYSLWQLWRSLELFSWQHADSEDAYNWLNS